jgi:cytochrome c oxidase subunit II
LGRAFRPNVWLTADGAMGACRMDDDRLTGAGRPIRSGRDIGRDGISGSYRPAIRATTFIPLLLPLLASCSGVQSALDPAGREASEVANLFFVMLIGGLVIWAGVVGLLFHAARKRRPYSEKEAGQIILWGGAVFPTVSLAALLSYAVWLMPNIRPWFGEGVGVGRVEVTGEQFWWRVRYLDEGGAVAFETANEVRVPVGERVVFLLNSPDVIHSFWIPVLGGKMDMIPGRENRLTLQAEKPGTYRGVCAEFCGASHALMAFTVHAMEPEAYEAWVAARRKASGGQDKEGLALFLRHGCAACHAISGTEARGTIGPDLTAFGERGSVGAGTLPNGEEQVARFIRDPGKVKPEARMPHFSMLEEAEIERIAAYLKGLR